MSLSRMRLLFGLAAGYDFVIGLVFLLAGPALFEATSVPPPNHWAYIHFAALLLMVFGVMFLQVAGDPRTNRNLIPFGILLKLCYSGLVLYYVLIGPVPLLFQPFAVIDAIMLVLFVLAYRALATPA